MSYGADMMVLSRDREAQRLAWEVLVDRRRRLTNCSGLECAVHAVAMCERYGGPPCPLRARALAVLRA